MAGTTWKTQVQLPENNRPGVPPQAEPESSRSSPPASSSGSLTATPGRMRRSLEPMATMHFVCFPFVSVSLYCSYLTPTSNVGCGGGQTTCNYKNPHPILTEGTHTTQMSWTFKLHDVTGYGVFKVFLWQRAHVFYVKRTHGYWGGRKAAVTAIHKHLSSLSLHDGFSWA